MVTGRHGRPGRPRHRVAGRIREQSGVITAAQARAAGITRNAIRWRVTRGQWQRLYPRVYATFSGPVPRRAWLYAAVLAAGRGAVLSHQSAAELAGLVPPGRPGDPIHVTIPGHRRVFAKLRGVVVHRSSHVEQARHPALLPPQTWIEHTILDLSQTARPLRDAFGWLALGVNSRRTTEGRLLAAMEKRPRMRWRRALREGLGDLRAGCRSVLELRYLREVERAHALPTAERQSPEGRLYLDVRYRRYGVRVELDGRAAHPDHLRHRDWERDNLAAELHEAPLRYMTPEVWEQPCAVAAQVARSLRIGGWEEQPRRCARAACLIADGPGGRGEPEHPRS